MFDLFSWSHIVILLTVALVVVGPKDLPRMMHMAGRWAGKARGMANEFKRSFDEMARQTELDELRKEVEALKASNPLADIHKSLSEPLPDLNETAPLPEAAPEPRSGEFQVNEEPRSGEFQVNEAPRDSEVHGAEEPHGSEVPTTQEPRDSEFQVAEDSHGRKIAEADAPLPVGAGHVPSPP